MATSMVVLATLLGIGSLAFFRTNDSLLQEMMLLNNDENCRKKTYGYADPANEAVDPQNIRSDRSRFPVLSQEAGPFGVPRNIHQDGAYYFPTFGKTPGLYNF